VEFLMPGQQQVVQHRHAAEQFQILKRAGDAHTGNLVWACLRQPPVPVADLSGGGVVKTGDAVEHAGFAGAVGPDDGGDQPGFDGHVYIGKRVQSAESEGNILNG
jgi:hypothetical protein